MRNTEQEHAVNTGEVRAKRTWREPRDSGLRGSSGKTMEDNPFSVPFPERSCAGKSGRR